VATGGPQVITRGGRGVLDAEKSRSYGFGVILTAPPEMADLSLAIDYYNVRVNDQVSLLGTSILDFCYEAADFPNNQYCDFIEPREQVQGTLTTFLNPYINIAMQKATGIDFAGRYGADVFGGKFIANLRATRNLKQIIQTFPEDDPFDYNGLLGYQGTTGGPKWVGDVYLRFTKGPWTFRWGVEYVGAMDTTNEVDPPVLADGTEVDYDLFAGTYWEHGLSVRYQWKDVGQITFGVNNLFNRKPPIISSHSNALGQFPRIGNYFNYSGYDFLGRSLFLNVTRNF
jgi:iron complex outermembrane receptor protein